MLGNLYSKIVFPNFFDKNQLGSLLKQIKKSTFLGGSLGDSWNVRFVF